MNVNWWDHSCLFRREGRDAVCIAKGDLHAMVGIAMTVAQGLDGLFIETDNGQMFCRYEIGYIGMLAGRPA